MDDDTIQHAIDRAHELHDHVRARVFARLAYPERIAELEAAERREAPADDELENLMWELDRRYHYQVGVRIGELSLPEGFSGVLRRSAIDNRPFLRCLKGAGLCLWRLGRWDEASAIFERMLWLNPADQQGIRFLIGPVHDRQRWEDQDG